MLYSGYKDDVVAQCKIFNDKNNEIEEEYNITDNEFQTTVFMRGEKQYTDKVTTGKTQPFDDAGMATTVSSEYLF